MIYYPCKNLLNRFWAMNSFLALVFCVFGCGGGGATSTSVPSSSITAPTGVTLSGVNSQTVGTSSFTSSTKIKVDWVAPSSGVVDHYTIQATDSFGGTPISMTATVSATTATLTELKSETSYSVVVSACKDAAGTDKASATAVLRTTSAEHWQLQGSGSSISGLTKIVSDGNVRISATRIGSEAGGVTANRIQLYYGPSGTSGKSVLVTALSPTATSATDSSSYLSFLSTMSSGTATTGLVSPTTATSSIGTVLTGQGIPLSASMGGKIRLFFEATGSDLKTRIFSVDSVDGYVGQDFNTGASAVCQTTADYSAGGGCAFTTVVGIEGDASGANLKIANARQNKIGYPILTDWRWDGAAGTFMVFTTDTIAGCSTAFMNHGYAVWSGSKWDVQYESGGCPKLFTNAQAMFPMHLGGQRYKMYYGDPSITTGKVNGSPLPFPGPKKIIYGDGNLTGQERVDFEDWEAQTNARGVVFLWPNGTAMDAAAEGYLDDFHFLAPTGSLDLQVMYLAITEGTNAPIAVGAILLNP